MSDLLRPTRATRLALAVSGAAGILFGAAILVWPTKAAVAVAAIIAIYAIVAGLIYLVIGIFGEELGAGGRIGHAVLGVLYVIAGAFTFSELTRSAAFLALFLTILVGVMWMIEGFTALMSIGKTRSGALTVVFAVLSIIAGFTLLSSPLWGAVFLWWFLGIALVVLGALNAGRALTGKA